MMWQDILFASSGAIFAIMLVPQLIDAYHGKGMNLISAALTTIVLCIQCYAYYTLGMYIAAIPSTATVWGLVAYYSYTRGRQQ